jgi:hypothetical protein
MDSSVPLDADAMVQLTAVAITLGAVYAATRFYMIKRYATAIGLLGVALIAGAVALFFGTFQIRLF